MGSILDKIVEHVLEHGHKEAEDYKVVEEIEMNDQERALCEEIKSLKDRGIEVKKELDTIVRRAENKKKILSAMVEERTGEEYHNLSMNPERMVFEIHECLCGECKHAMKPAE